MSRSEENLLWDELKKDSDINVLVGNMQKSLPKNGWIYPCHFCSAPTARVVKLEHNHKLYYVFRCKECLNYKNGLFNIKMKK